MNELAADGIPVTVTCRVLKLSRQPYYRWRADPVRPAELVQAYRADALFDAHRDDPEFGHRLLADEARIVGYSIDSRMKASLAVTALENAVARRVDVAGCVVHSDRGSQFRSRKYLRPLARHDLIGSMGRVASCGDNAAIESFFALLQKNVLDRRSWTTREQVRIAIHASHHGCVTRNCHLSLQQTRGPDSTAHVSRWSVEEVGESAVAAQDRKPPVGFELGKDALGPRARRRSTAVTARQRGGSVPAASADGPDEPTSKRFIRRLAGERPVPSAPLPRLTTPIGG